MAKVVGMALLLMSVAGMAFGVMTVSAPEIDASSAATAVGLISGGLLVLRSRRRKSQK